MFVIGTTEIQFLAYLQLVRNRLKILNNVFKNFKQIIKNRKKESQNSTFKNEKEIQFNFEDYHKINQQFCINELSTYKHKIIDEHTSINRRNVNGFIKQPTTLTSVPPERFNFKNVVKTIAARNKVNDRLNETFYRCIDYTDYIILIQHIYSKLEKVASLINSSYGVQIVIILIIKFTTLTSLLYFCCMILLK